MREVVYDLEEFASLAKGKGPIRLSFKHLTLGNGLEHVKAMLFCPLSDHVLIWEDTGIVALSDEEKSRYEESVLSRIREYLGFVPKRGRWE